jgi:peptide subunit release factor 1 (eRF1)
MPKESATQTETSEPIATALEDPLERLLSFEPTSLPVVSVYLNTEPDSHGRDPEVIPYLQRQFKSLGRTWAAGTPERQSFDRDVERILAYTDGKIDPAANGVALFACAGAAEFFEAVQLAAPIDGNRIYVYNQPHIYLLTRIDDEYPRYAALVADANRGRIFVFGLGRTIEIADVKGEKVHRVKVGGWSQARYQRRVGNAHQQFAKEALEKLEQIVSAEHIKRIVIGGDLAIAPALKEQIPQHLAALVVDMDVMKLDVKASEQDILGATFEKMREYESKSESEKVARLLEEYRSGGLAVAGPKDTLDALANGQVDELLISDSLDRSRPERETVDAIVAPEIPDSTGGTGSDEPRQVSLPDLLVTKARQTDATITFIRDVSLLDGLEGVGALLRWRS